MATNAEYFDDGDFYAPAVAVGNGNGQSLAMAPVNTNANSMTTVDQSRAVAEVQAALVIAKSQPRSEIQAEHKILEACKRPGLAMTAIYSYKRGTEQVEGPSIRLAETMARYWGNMNYGFREVSREGASSEIEAYAWDLETNTKAVRQFQMKHWRDTKKGGYEVTAERDKYELMANFAQRRVRACILEIIPGDIVEAALEQCNRTLKGNSDVPLIDRIKKMVVAFEDIGVSSAMIEARVQHSIDSINIHEFRQLGKLFNAIRDGYSTVEELFEAAAPATAPATEAAASQKEPAGRVKPKTSAEAAISAAAKAAKDDDDGLSEGPSPFSDDVPLPDDRRSILDSIRAELKRLGQPRDTLPEDLAKIFGGDPSDVDDKGDLKNILEQLKGRTANKNGGLLPDAATVPCPNRDYNPVDELDCASCRHRQGCPSWK